MVLLLELRKVRFVTFAKECPNNKNEKDEEVHNLIHAYCLPV
jgi:hypothetical protein